MGQLDLKVKRGSSALDFSNNTETDREVSVKYEIKDSALVKTVEQYTYYWNSRVSIDAQAGNFAWDARNSTSFERNMLYFGYCISMSNIDNYVKNLNFDNECIDLLTGYVYEPEDIVEEVVENLLKLYDFDQVVYALFCSIKLMHDVEMNPGPLINSGLSLSDLIFHETPPHFEVCYCDDCRQHAAGDSYLLARLLANYERPYLIRPLVDRHFNTAHNHRLIFKEMFERLLSNNSQMNWDPIGMKAFGLSLKESSDTLKTAVNEFSNSSAVSKSLESISNTAQNVSKNGIPFDFGISSLLESLKGPKGVILLCFVVFLLELLDRKYPTNSGIKTLKYMVAMGVAAYAIGDHLRDIIISWIANTSQSDFNLADWVGVSIQGIGWTLFGCTFPLTSFREVMMHINQFVRNIDCVDKILNSAKGFFEKIITMMFSLFGVDISNWFVSADNRLKELQIDCANLLERYVKDPAAVDVKFSMEVENLNMKLLTMVKNTPNNQVNSPINVVLSKLLDKVNLLQRYSAESGIGKGERNETGLVVVAGAPGTGKTFSGSFVSMFMAISVAAQEDLVKETDFKKRVYVWPADPKHHDQYCGQSIILFPDLFTQTDAEGQPSEPSYLIYIVGDQPLCLPAAELTKKQMLWVTSEGGLAYTNTTYISDNRFKSISNPDGLRRRLNECGWYQWVNPKYAKRDFLGNFIVDPKTNRILGYENKLELYAMLDRTLIPTSDYLVEDCYFYRRHNFTTGTFADDKIYDLRGFLSEVGKYLRGKKETGEMKRTQVKNMISQFIEERVNPSSQMNIVVSYKDDEYELRNVEAKASLLALQEEKDTRTIVHLHEHRQIESSRRTANNSRRFKKPDEFYECNSSQFSFQELFNSAFPYAIIDSWFPRNDLIIFNNEIISEEAHGFLRSIWTSHIPQRRGLVHTYQSASQFYEIIVNDKQYSYLADKYAVSVLIKLASSEFEEVKSNYPYWVICHRIKDPISRLLVYTNYLLQRSYVELERIIGNPFSFITQSPFWVCFRDGLSVASSLSGAIIGGTIIGAVTSAILGRIIRFFIPNDENYYKGVVDDVNLSIHMRNGSISCFINEVDVPFRCVRYGEKFPIRIYGKDREYLFDGSHFTDIKQGTLEKAPQGMFSETPNDYNYLAAKMDNFYVMFCTRVNDCQSIRHPCNLVFLGERIAVGVRHVTQVFRKMIEMDPNTIYQIQLVKFVGGEYDTSTINYRWDDIEILEDEELAKRDLVIYKFKTGKLHPRIEKMIPPKECLDYIMNKTSGQLVGKFIKKPVIGTTPTAGIQQVPVWMNFHQGTQTSYPTAFSFNVEGEDHKFYFDTQIKDTWTLKGVNTCFVTEAGDCTSPCFLTDERKNFCVNKGYPQAQQPWLVYLHTAIQGLVPTGVPIYRELFSKYFDMMHTNIGFSIDVINSNIAKHNEVLEEAGYVKVSQGSFLGEPVIKQFGDFHTATISLPGEMGRPFKSDIRRSDLFGIEKLTRFPSRLVDYVDKKTNEVVRVMPNARKMYGSNTTNFNSCLFSAVIADTLTRFVNDSPPICKNDVLTLDQAIYGDKAYNLSGINWNGSPGFYFRYAKNNFHWCEKGKRFLMNFEGDTLSENGLEIIRKLFNDSEERLKKGERLYDVFVDNLKDELLPVTKSTRLFCSAGFIKLLLDRKYFGSFCGWIFRGHINNGIAIGINPYSRDWDALFSHLRRKGDASIFGDYSKFDKKQLRIFMEAVLELSHIFYDDRLSQAYYMRILLFEDMLDSVHCTYDVDGKNYIYTWDHGNTSGNFLTAIINSVVNILIIHVTLVICQILFNGKNPDKGLVSYDFEDAQKISYQVLGDDLVLVVEDLPYFTFNSMQKVIKKYIGMDFTDELKGANETTPDYRPLESGMFLARYFLVDHFNGIPKVYCPLRKPSIIEVDSWVRGKTDPLIEVAKIEGMNLELSEWGETTFNEIVPVHAKRCHAVYGIYPKYTNFNVARSRVMILASYAYSFDTFVVDGVVDHEDSERLHRFLSLMSTM